ncbi:U2 small nuclear ribonucleoprotein A [Ectocarpus siliculosus]|uniref:U2 small nuclear ribonucleoprotein A n=1 Tax=Ectocarpus siliculosus TaxID=2880 RepID=D8LSC4_ECTSI|nr:U2 small nuclear ribonucleoprotein A [Ectocarpus siliculosus]|eukprot:CBN75181.1 U2 small nuclear ribonucleoprotein A [Ectocarpus siliculosus]
MRLTADIIMHARASINPCDERELDLRGYKIPMIENLGVTQDQFDAMDFSDNEIKKLDNFPRYKRLSSLLLCNNHVSKISEDLGTALPNLSCLILTNNKLSTLAELKGLGTCTKLTMLSLLHNEVVNKQYYRLYMINLIPSLKQLDFQKVTVKERESAVRLARSQAGQAMIQDVAQQAEKAKTFTPGAPAAEEQKLTDEHRAIYADRIAKATTVEEIEMLSKKIQAGIIPSANYKQGGGAPAANGAAAPAAAAAAPGKPPAATTTEVEMASPQTASPQEPSGTAVAAAGKAAAPAAAPMDTGTAATAPEAPAAPAQAAPTEASSMDVDGAEEGKTAEAPVPGADAGNGEAEEEPPATSEAGRGGEGKEEASSAKGGADGGGGGDAMVDDEGGEEAAAETAEETATEAPAETGEGEGDMEQEEGGGPKLSEAEIKSYKGGKLCVRSRRLVMPMPSVQESTPDQI